MTSNDSANVSEALTVLTGGFVGTVLIAAFVLLALAALLMPLYVVSMAAEVKKLRLMMERHLNQQGRVEQELQQIRYQTQK